MCHTHHNFRKERMNEGSVLKKTFGHLYLTQSEGIRLNFFCTYSTQVHFLVCRMNDELMMKTLLSLSAANTASLMRRGPSQIISAQINMTAPLRARHFASRARRQQNIFNPSQL